MNEIIKKEFERIKFECRPNRDIEIGYFDVFSVDYDVINDGTVDELRRQIDDIIAEIKAKGGR